MLKRFIFSTAALLSASPLQAQNVYFGTLHAHTSYSDGSGTPAEAFEMADQAGMNFLAITEHNHRRAEDSAGERRDGILIATDPSLYSGPPTSLVATSRRVTRDGSFVGLHGQEFSTISSGNHVNVFDVGSVIPVTNGDFRGLIDWLRTNPDSAGNLPLVQFNHPGIEEAHLEYGRDEFPGDERNWVRELDAVVELIEVLNAPALRAGTGFPSHADEANYFRYLNLGFHIAPTAGHDNHYRNWGTSTEARTAIIADRLTLADLISAMRQRHVYATEDANLRIIFRVNGALSGDVVAPPPAGSELDLRVDVHDPNEPNARYRVDVFQDRPGGDQARRPVESFTFQGNAQAPRQLEGVRFSGPGEYVLLRVTQFSDEEHGTTDTSWTAPVWFEHAAAITPSLPVLRIVGLVPNPPGDDSVGEEVTIRNPGSGTVSLSGWQLRDRAGRTWSLAAGGAIGAGLEVTVRRAGQDMALNNDGDAVELLDPEGRVVQSYEYERASEGERLQPPQ